MSKDFDYYAILGIRHDASPEEIREAFSTLSLGFTPDQRDAATNSQFQRIQNAYEVLSDPARRETYDLLIAETSTAELNVEVVLSREKVDISDSNQLIYLLVNIKPPKQQNEVRPLNISLVIDRSTSMQGRRLQSVKTAVELLIGKLSPEDTLSIISFSDRAEVVVPASPLANKSQINAQVRAIQASGGTEIYQGIKAGVDELRKSNLKAHSNQLILLTDGHTYGDSRECLELAQKIASENIGISAFGLGSEWNDQFLDALVSPSGGQSGYIEDPSNIVTFLQERISGLGLLYVQNVRLKPELPQSLKLRYGFKLIPFAQPLNIDGDDIKLGDIESRSPLSFLLEIGIEPQPTDTRINIPLSFTAIVPKQAREMKFKETTCVFVIEDAPRILPPDKIVEAVRVLNMYRMNEKVWEEVEAGRIDVATKKMQHLSTRLLEAGQTELAQQASMEIEKIQHAGTMSLEGRKRLKYGTRAMFNQTIKLDDE